MNNTATPITAVETGTVHVLVDTRDGWHSSPISDADFQALTRRHPYVPLRYHWVHIEKQQLGVGAQSKAIAEKYPEWVADPVADLVERLVRREVEHARYFLRRGETDGMGFPINEEGRVRFYGQREPEPWAITIAERELRAEWQKRVLDDAKAERWADQRLGGKPKRKRTPRPRCKESGRVIFFEPMPGMPEYDRCPHCGRVVRIRADGSAPEHTEPSTIRGPA